MPTVKEYLRDNLHYHKPTNKFRLGKMERFLAFIALIGSILLLSVQLIHWE